MADAELKVLLSADASNLESAINKVTAELTNLEKVQAGAGKAAAAGAANTKKAAQANDEAAKSAEKNASATKKGASASKENASAAEKEGAAKKGSSSSIDKDTASTEKNTSAKKKNKKQTEDLTNSVEKSSKKQKQASWLVRTSADEMQDMGNKLQDAGRGIDQATKPLQVASVALAAGGVAAAKFAIDFEDSFASVKKTVDGTPEQLEAIKQGIIDMSTVGINGHNAIPLTTTQLNELASAGGQLGIARENVLEFTETMAMMESATNLAGAEGAATLARFRNVMNVDQGEIRNIASSIVDLGNNSATTEAEIADMALRMGKFGQTVGMGAADVLGYSAALSSLGVEAQAGGSAVGRVWQSIETAVAKGGAELNAFAKYSGKSAKEFQNQWNTDAKGAFNGLLKGLKAADNLTLALEEIGVNNTIDVTALQSMVNGFELVEESVTRANNAYTENSALMTEFNAKAETTASQLAVTKNNLVEAARSIGETFLPMIASGSNSVKNFAQGLANLSDGQKEALVSTAGWVIGLGAAGKVTSSTVKGVGNLVEGVGKVKTAFSAGGALAKFAPALLKVGAAAGPAAIGIAAVSTAVWAGKAAYDYWYDSQYRWTEGLSKGNETIKENLNEVKSLTELQGEVKDLKLVIESPESSKEAVDNAKTKLDKIVALLEDEYDLVINSDNSNLDKTLSSAIRKSEAELQQSINNQQQKLNDLRPKYDEAKVELPQLQAEYEAADKIYTDLNTLYTEFDTLNTEYKSGTISQQEYKKGNEDIAESLRALGFEYADAERLGGFFLDELTNAKDKVDKLKPKVDDLTATQEEYKAVSTELANMQSENLELQVQQGDTTGVERTIASIEKLVKNAELDAEGYAQVVVEKLNGISLDDAMSKGGADLESWINNYIDVSKKFGVAATETALNAGLFRNGFKSIEEAANAGKLDEVTASANEYAKTIEGFPEGVELKINAETKNIDLIDETGEKLAEIDGKTGEINLKVNDKTEGTVEGTEQKLSELDGKEVSFDVNADGTQATSTIDGVTYQVASYDSATGEALLTADGKSAAMSINTATGKVTAFDSVTGTAKLQAIDNISETARNAAGEISRIKDKRITITAVFKRVGERISGLFAKGTQDAPGGLAMINDQKGVSDPRELVEVNGKGYIFEGRDVILPLPKHSKVYTASQTKEIMSAQGIPHYASGKNNEAWEKDKEAWQHRQKTSYVTFTPAETLEWLDEMKKKYANDTEVIKEIEEEMVAATKDSWSEWQENLEYSLKMGLISEREYYDELRKYRDEYVFKDSDEYKDITLELHKGDQDKLKKQNEDSLAWIKNRNSLNDWDEIGDSAADAYKRIMDRNREAVDAGLITWEEYQEVGNEAFDSLLNGYVDYANDWIDKQKETSGMTAEEELEAIERVEKNVNAFFENLGELTEEQYIVKLAVDAQLAEDKFAAIENRISQWEDDADWYQEQSDVYGWGFDGRGITKTDFLYDKIEHYQTELDTGGLNESQYNEIMRRRDEAYLELYQAKDDELEEILKKQRDAINDLEEALSQQVNDLRSTWDAEDRAADMEEVRRDLEKYEGAATKEGQEKYKELQEELKSLEREEQIYQIEQENAALLKELEDEYADMEAEKKELLKEIQFDISGYTKQLDNNNESINNLAASIQEALANLAPSQTEQNLNMDITNVINDKVDIDALVSRLISRSTSFYGGGRK